MREFFYILLGYLSGSILFAKIMPQKLCHVDVTRMGKDQNPGTFNAFAAACLRTVMFPAWKLGCLGISAVVCWRHIRSGEREPLTFTFLPVFDKMKENKKKKEWEVWK